MGSGRSALKDATLYSLPYDYRCFGIGGVVPTRGSTPSWPPVKHCFRSRPTVCVNLVATDVQSVGN